MSSKKQILIERLIFLGQIGSTETALFHQKAAERLGVGVTDTKAISVLMQEGPLTAGQLGDRLHITTGAVTNLVDRLEKRGMVNREADSNDRRKVLVTVVREGFESESNAYISIGEAFAKLYTTFSEKDLELIIHYQERQIEITKEQIANMPKAKTAEGLREDG